MSRLKLLAVSLPILLLLCEVDASPIGGQNLVQGRPGREIIALPCKSRGGVEGVCMSALNCLKSLGKIVDRCAGHANSASCCSKVAANDASSLSNGLAFGSSPPTLSSKPDAPSSAPAAISNNSTNEDDDHKKVCGKARNRNRNKRIVGGITADYGQWPWQISLNIRNGTSFSHQCGASLLTEYWAITAAHCVRKQNTGDILLRIGIFDLDSGNKSQYVERRIDMTVIHPQYRSTTLDNDLALLRFAEPVRFRSNILPICLPEGDPDFVGQAAFISGWGRLHEDGPLPPKLQQASVPVLNNSKCESTYLKDGLTRENLNVFLCAGYPEGNQDTCKGDSGGPLMVEHNGRWILAGITSWGHGCGRANRPGVYTRVTEFRDWINKFINIGHLDTSKRNTDFLFTKLFLLP